MRMTLKGLSVAGIALAAGTLIAWAQASATTDTAATGSTATSTPNSSGMMSDGMMGGQNMTGNGSTMDGTTTTSPTTTESTGMMDTQMGSGNHMQQMMQMWGMTPQMMQRGHMMLNAPQTRDDPAAILGLHDQLGLTSDQVAKLETLQKRTDEQARAVLTEGQQTALDKVPAGPQSFAQMYDQMLSHMRQIHGQLSSADGQTNTTPWAMMQSMMRSHMNGMHQQNGS